MFLVVQSRFVCHLCQITGQSIRKAILVETPAQRVEERLSTGSCASVICTGNDTGKRELVVNACEPRGLKGLSAKLRPVIGLCFPPGREDGVCLITNLGNDTATLYKLSGTRLNDISQAKVIQETDGMNSLISRSWNMCLEGSCEKAKLSIILTWIKKITNDEICICSKTEANTLNVIVHWNCRFQNLCKEEWYALRMDDISSVPNSARSRIVGNGVTAPVAEWLGQRILTALGDER